MPIEGWRLEFRAEAFNVLNHPVWGNPRSSRGSSTFRKISSTEQDSRGLQLALKYYFYSR
jgi:hypothetical protein